MPMVQFLASKGRRFPGLQVHEMSGSLMPTEMEPQTSSYAFNCLQFSAPSLWQIENCSTPLKVKGYPQPRFLPHTLEKFLPIWAAFLMI